MLRVAAAIGQEVSFALWREACGLGPTRLLDLIDEAVDVQVLEARPARRFRFAHALIREALYDDLLASERVELHRRVGEAIERLFPASLDEHLPELAYHFARFAPGGDAEKALDYASRAARRASSLLAYEDAAQLYELALDILPLVPDGLARQRQVEILLALGDAYVRAGDTPKARAAFEGAANAARARRDAANLARAALGCGGLGLGVPPGTVDGALVALIEEAIAYDAHSYPTSTRARLLARLALELYFSDATARRHELMSEAWALAGNADADTLAYVTHARLVGLWDLTPPAERMEWSNELIALAERTGDQDLGLRAHSYRLLEIIDTGLADAWEPELETITRLAERLREPRFLGMATGTRAMRSLWVGRFAEAEALGQQALEMAPSDPDMQTSITIAAQTFFMRRLQGRSEEVEAYARAIVAAAPAIPGTHCMLILALCDLGRFDEARAEMELLGDGDFDLLRRSNRIASLVPWLAEASALLGDRPRMQSLYRDLLPLSARNISLQARLCFGPAAFYLGMITAGLGRLGEAIGYFETAQALAARMGGRPLAAMIRIEHGRALRALGDVGGARELIEAARETATALGLHALIDRIAALETDRLRTATLRREGQLWTIAAGGTVLRCKRSKGLHYLSHLLRHPGRSFHVLELIALDEPAERAGVEIARMSRAQLDELGMHVGAPQCGEPLADTKALAAYRRQLEDLNSELAEATQFNDLERRAHIQEEIEALTDALASAVGLGGRLRASGSFAERARLNVTRAVRTAIQRIAEGHPELGRHLDRAVRTGSFCGYDPEPGAACTGSCEPRGSLAPEGRRHGAPGRRPGDAEVDVGWRPARGAGAVLTEASAPGLAPLLDLCRP